MYYAPTTPPENQLPTGVPVRPVAKPLPKREPVMEENWNDEQWEEERPIAPPPMRRKAEPLPYEEEASLEEDMWDDSDDYRPQRVNIPKKQAMPEYEEY